MSAHNPQRVTAADPQKTVHDGAPHLVYVYIPVHNVTVKHPLPHPVGSSLIGNDSSIKGTVAPF